MANQNKYQSSLVYSSEFGTMCPECERPHSQCICEKPVPIKLKDGFIRVGRETKGRKGSGVSVISGLSLDQEKMRDLAKKLKRLCGTGGTVKNNQIEIQGDHRDKLVAALSKEGYKVKKAGG